jgi:mRNA interferase HigB
MLEGRLDRDGTTATTYAWLVWEQDRLGSCELVTADVKGLYATASIVTAERVVFNVKGNAYRLVVAVDFEKGIVWIKWIGTHRDYDRVDVKKVEHGR